MDKTGWLDKKSTKMQLINSYFPSSPYHNRIYFGQSGTGKTHHIVEYVLNFNKYYPTSKIRKIIIVAPHFLPLYHKIVKKYGNLCLYSKVFDNTLLDAFEENNTDGSICLVIIDDFASKINKSPFLEEIFTTLTRHKRLQVMYSCQSLYSSTSDVYKSIVKNAHVIILMNSPRERNSIQILFRQLFGNNTAKYTNFVLSNALEENYKRYNHPYYNISINTTPSCERGVEVLSDILSDYPLAYINSA